MRTKLFLCLFTTLMLSLSSRANSSEPVKKQPVNYTVILDLSDRVLNENQLQKDLELIRKLFREFETTARRGLILTSKDRFAVKIIPQKGSPLDIAYFEDKLQLKLDEVPVQLKNKKMEAFAASFEEVLKRLGTGCMIGEDPDDFFGVDIWAYLNDNAYNFGKEGYRNLVLLTTDGYFDFESRSHVLQAENRFSSTQFLNELTGIDWREKADREDYGLIPVMLRPDIEWVISGISSKKEQDILQHKKIIYVWEKWLRESGAEKYHFILNNSGSEMSSRLLEML